MAQATAPERLEKEPAGQDLAALQGGEAPEGWGQAQGCFGAACALEEAGNVPRQPPVRCSAHFMLGTPQYEQAGQISQAPARLAVLKVPLAQGLQVLGPPGENIPSGQILQVATPAAEAVPAGQVLHDLEPGRLAKRPAGQTEQASLPVSLV